MKKLLGIVVLGLFWCNISFTDDNHLDDFNKWLYQSGNHQYLNLEQSTICKNEPMYSSAWYYNNCDKFKGTNNLKITFYK